MSFPETALLFVVLLVGIVLWGAIMTLLIMGFFRLRDIGRRWIDKQFQ